MQNQTVSQDEQGNPQLAMLPRPSSGTAAVTSRPRPQPPQELSLIGFQDQIALSYFFGSDAWAPLWQPVFRISQISDSEERKNNNQTALLAMAFGFMGNDRRERSLQTKGKQLFGKTLRDTRSLLAQAPKEQCAMLLVTIVMLGMYTVSYCPSHRGSFQEKAVQLTQDDQVYCGLGRGSYSPHRHHTINALLWSRGFPKGALYGGVSFM
jgi:hypothetical protein